MEEDEPDLSDLYDEECKPVLKVVDKPANIRAHLLLYGIPLSGKDEVNREHLVQYCRDHTPPFELYWMDPRTGKYIAHVDEAPKKGKKNQARNKIVPKEDVECS